MSLDSANLFKKCLPQYSTDIARTGAVTNCSISSVEEADFASVYFDGSSKARDLRNMFVSHLMGRVYGQESYGLYDLFQMLKKPIGSKKVTIENASNGAWQIRPFINMQRKAVLNTEYWTCYYKGTGSGSNIQVWLQSQHSLQPDARWFPAGMRVFLLATGGSGDAVHTEWEIAASPAPVVVADPGAGAADDIPCVEVELIPNNSNSNMPAAKTTLPTVTSGAKLGLVIRGTANVSDFESYCDDTPSINTTQQFPFWLETTRYTLQEDTLTKQYLDAVVAGNDYYRTFQHVESVERNRQTTVDFQRRQVNAMFYNKPLPNQDLANWGSLTQIAVPSNASLALPMEGSCIGYKANSVGIIEQLAECNRLYDLQGAVLSIQELMDELYNVYRARKSAGVDPSVIELMTDTAYAVTLHKAIMTYVIAQGAPSAVTFNYELSAQLQKGAENGPFGLKFFKFQLIRPAVELRILFSMELDDILAAHVTAGNTNFGRTVLCLDWSSIYRAPAFTNQKVNTSGTAQDVARVDNDAMCIMDRPVKTVRHFSETGTVVVDSPDCSFILENVGSGDPAQGVVGSGTDMKGA